MAKTQFKSFQFTTIGNLSKCTEKDIAYLIRTDEVKEEGFIFFNGKKYGNVGPLETRVNAIISAMTLATTSLSTGETLKSISEQNGKVVVETQDIDIAMSQVEGLEEALAIAQTEITEKPDGHVTVTVTDVDGHLTATIAENDIASAGELSAEIANRESADTVILAKTVNGKALSTNPLLNGGDIKMDGYTKSSVASAVSTGDTINQAIGKLEKSLEAVGGDAIVEIEAGDGINMTSKVNHKQTASVKVATSDKVLTVGANGVAATLTIAYNSTTRKIVLSGINDVEIGTVSCDDFIKDGMLWGEKAFVATGETEEVTITKGSVTQTKTFSGLTEGNQYLAFCFTDGAAENPQYTWDIVDLQNLVDVYTAGSGLNLTDNQFSIKIDTASESTFLTVSSAGLKVDGIQSAIDTTIATEIAKLDAEETGQDTYTTVTVTETDGKVTGVNVEQTVQGITSATASAKGLAEAYDVKTYVDQFTIFYDGDDAE